MKPILKFHNIETDEVIEREMTDEEFVVYEAEQAEYAAKLLAADQAAIDKAALLAKLGITEAEARLLMGGN